MAGGIFITHNKVRPGFYHRFTASPQVKNLFGEIGVAALPLELDWGKEDAIQAIDSDSSEATFLKLFGRKKTEMLLVNEVLKRARTLLFYRINAGGTAATLDMTPQPVMATAKYAGILGNQIRVAIEEEDAGVGTYTVKTYVNTILRNQQNGVQNAEDIQSNSWVDFSGSGAITAAAGGQLTGGTNGTATKNDYEQFLMQLESYDCNAFGLMSDEADIKNLFVDAARRRIEELGKLSQCFISGVTANVEYVSSVHNGVVLRNGLVINRNQAVAWVVGAASACGPAQSMTYMAYDDAVAPDTLLADDVIKQALLEGQVVFTAQTDINGQPIAVVEQDVNTLIRFTESRPQPWSKNRVVRALYYMVNSLTRVWKLHYIGKVDNNEIGRGLFKADLVSLMRSLVDQGAFENFDAQTDILVNKGESSDAVVAELCIQPVDAMEKMYFTVEVSA